jgi:hypothetical protein
LPRERCAMRKPTFVSQRTDGRGHYPAGRRRSGLRADQHRRVIRYLGRLQRLGYSLSAVGKAIGRNPKTVARWHSGQSWPDEESEKKLRLFKHAVRKLHIGPHPKRRWIRYTIRQRDTYLSKTRALRKKQFSFAAISRMLKGPSERTLNRWRRRDGIS